MSDVKGPRQNSVEAFSEAVRQLMAEAAEYAGSGVYSADAANAINKLRVLTAGLNAALDQIRMFPPLGPTVVEPQMGSGGLPAPQGGTP